MALLVLTACATGPRVSVDAVNDFSVQEYQTYALMPLRSESGAPPAAFGPSILRGIRDSVHDTLQAVGYEEAEAEEADFLVVVHGQSLPRVDVEEWGMRFHYYDRFARYYPPDIDQYTEQTLIVDVIDAESEELVWRGSTMRQYRSGMSVSAEAVTQDVRDILGQFPVRY